ncbi:hypothetical protein [Nocardia sp. alder85J]|uniref:hypothetical protein n=1 Tax=Nocardia sp. alder85J TaxID=2862949 RepID=UPI001CD1EA7A|nr:hypothetical protein [Nocardia sp. alder85J]MCX4099258.1 hypothetical protein [Nocardia sp. alder85J]
MNPEPPGNRLILAEIAAAHDVITDLVCDIGSLRTQIAETRMVLGALTVLTVLGAFATVVAAVTRPRH